MEVAKADAVLRMMDKGFNANVISECLDLSIDDVRMIAKAAT